MRVAIIGAGPAGLVAAKYVKDSNFQVDVYERRRTIGGVWRDRDGPENSKDDVIATSPIYDNLRLNTPLVTVTLEGLEHNCSEDKIDYPWTMLNQYLKKYADKFDLRQHIHLETEVIQVSRKNNEWKVKTKHLPTGRLIEKFYDAVFVCHGHEDIPYVPEFEGISSFQGIQMHSKLFRNSKQFQNKNVLVIGSGASGIDIVLILSPDVNTVYFSHHKDTLIEAPFPKNVIQKSDIKRFTNDSVIFVDDSTAKIDVVIYCTGYQYNIDFLDETCGVSLGKKYIRNLYKEMISIEEPTLIFFAVQTLFFSILLAELQAKVALKVIKNEIKLPPKEEMLEDTRKWEEKCRSEGLREEQFSILALRGCDYMIDIARFASLPEPSKPLVELMKKFFDRFINEPLTFRNHTYKIIDGSTFVFK